MHEVGQYYDAKRLPSDIKWRPVTERKTVPTDHGPIVLYPGKHVELLDLANGHRWGNLAEDFIRRNKLTGRALEVFKRHYPHVEIPG